MRIHKYIHSCLLIKENGKNILIDPGSFSFIEKKISPMEFQGISAVLITHQHQDHIDIPSLKVILKNNDQAVVISNSGVEELLKYEDIPVKVLEYGELMIDDFHIEALSAIHDRVLGPSPQNTAYVINNILLHPGDSLSPDLLKFKGIPVLALPVIAPWNKRFEVAQFAQDLMPKIAIPIHDGFIKDFFLKSQNEIYGKYLLERNIKFRPLNDKSEFVEV